MPSGGSWMSQTQEALDCKSMKSWIVFCSQHLSSVYTLQWNGGELGHTLVAACRTNLNLITAHIEQKPISTNGLKSAPIECAEAQLLSQMNKVPSLSSLYRSPTVGTADFLCSNCLQLGTTPDLTAYPTSNCFLLVA